MRCGLEAAWYVLWGGCDERAVGLGVMVRVVRPVPRRVRRGGASAILKHLWIGKSWIRAWGIRLAEDKWFGRVGVRQGG